MPVLDRSRGKSRPSLTHTHDRGTPVSDSYLLCNLTDTQTLFPAIGDPKAYDTLMTLLINFGIEI